MDGTLLAKLSLDFSMNCILLHWLVGADYISPCYLKGVDSVLLCAG